MQNPEPKYDDLAFGKQSKVDTDELAGHVKGAQRNILIEDQIRNNFQMMTEAAERSAPRNRIERLGWFVVAFVNAMAAVAIASMMIQDRFYVGLVVPGFFSIFSYKLFRKAFRR